MSSATRTRLALVFTISRSHNFGVSFFSSSLARSHRLRSTDSANSAIGSGLDENQVITRVGMAFGAVGLVGIGVRSMNTFVFEIDRLSIPFEVAQSVVLIVPVEVPSVQSFRSRALKCSQYQRMNSKCSLLPGLMETHRVVSGVVRGGAKQFAGSEQAPDAPEVANLISTFVAHNGCPRFRRRSHAMKSTVRQCLAQGMKVGV